jgi:lipopolysaccharide biosynthesis glycosyltransferase
MINLVCATNLKYFPYCLAMLTSVIRHSSQASQLRIFLLVSADLPDSYLSRLKLLCHHNSVSLQVLYPVASYFSKLPQIKYLSKEAYYRIYFADKFPQIKRFIYLDCDLIVRQDLKNLWDINLQGKIIAAAEDSTLNKFYDKNIKAAHYFNSGVLVVDAVKFRQSRISRLITRYLTSGVKIYYADQDGLNYALQGKWKKLNTQWNVMSAQVNQFTAQNAYLVHFNGDNFFLSESALIW